MFIGRILLPPAILHKFRCCALRYVAQISARLFWHASDGWMMYAPTMQFTRNYSGTGTKRDTASRVPAVFIERISAACYIAQIPLLCASVCCTDISAFILARIRRADDVRPYHIMLCGITAAQAQKRDAASRVPTVYRRIFYARFAACQPLSSAIISTSASTPLGRSRPPTQLLAGFAVKYSPYTALKAAKSAISCR